MCVAPHPGWEGKCCLCHTTGRGQWKLCLNSPYAPLGTADFNLYTVAVINSNRECNSFAKF